MTRARMPRPHEVAAARRDPRLLRAVRGAATATRPGAPRSLPERRSGDVLSGAERAGRRRGRALPRPATSRGRAWPGRWRSVTATACGAAPRRASAGRCWSPGAAACPAAPDDRGRAADARPADGRDPAPCDCGRAAADAGVALTPATPAAARRGPATRRAATPRQNRPGGRGTATRSDARAGRPRSRSTAGRRRRPACSSSGTAPAAASTRPTCVAVAGRGGGRRARGRPGDPALPGGRPPRAGPGRPPRRGLDRGASRTCGTRTRRCRR